MNFLVIFFLKSLICVTVAERLIFQDEFNDIDESKWKFEQTLSGGGDWQFQWYVPDRENAYVQDGILHIKPTLTADKIGEDELFKKKVRINRADCTSSMNYGCYREGTHENIINPIRSASIQSKSSFKYGTVEIRAKLPAGDWLRPYIKLLPKGNAYGGWPASGEIVLLEARGNRELYDRRSEPIGISQVTSTLHYGPSYDANGWQRAHYEKNSQRGFNEDFHIYKLEWSKTGIIFFIDNEQIGEVRAQPDAFWRLGEFEDNHKDKSNPWSQGSEIAPFDKEFFVSIGLAVGGVSDYFSDDFENVGYDKPWSNKSPNAPLNFWRAKENWYKTWTSSKDSADFQIDYVKIYSK